MLSSCWCWKLTVSWAFVWIHQRLPCWVFQWQYQLPLSDMMHCISMATTTPSSFCFPDSILHGIFCKESHYVSRKFSWAGFTLASYLVPRIHVYLTLCQKEVQLIPRCSCPIRPLLLGLRRGKYSPHPLLQIRCGSQHSSSSLQRNLICKPYPHFLYSWNEDSRLVELVLVNFL